MARRTRSHRLTTDTVSPMAGPVAPPLPSTGGSYELEGNEWVCVQQTQMPEPAPPEPDCPACTAPPPDLADPEPAPTTED